MTNNIATDDDKVANHNYAALKSFYRKFPKFRSNDLYLTGESYAGFYIPTLAVRIMRGLDLFPLTFKGFAIGNGIFDHSMNDITQWPFAYYHGLIGEASFKEWEKQCCIESVDTCHLKNRYNQGSEECNNVMGPLYPDPNPRIYQFVSGVNIYDIYRKCSHPPEKEHNYKRYWFEMDSLLPGLANHLRKSKVKVKGPQCSDDLAITSYLNMPEVRNALNIPENLPKWEICSNLVGYLYNRSVNENMTAQFKEIVKFPNSALPNFRMLIYNGDTDFACNFIMNQKFVASLELPLYEYTRPWLVDRQVAGYVTRYQKLDFLTVKGTGHMVPEWKPVEALQMIKNFVQNIPY